MAQYLPRFLIRGRGGGHGPGTPRPVATVNNDTSDELRSRIDLGPSDVDADAPSKVAASSTPRPAL